MVTPKALLQLKNSNQNLADFLDFKEIICCNKGINNELLSDECVRVSLFTIRRFIFFTTLTSLVFYQ